MNTPYNQPPAPPLKSSPIPPHQEIRDSIRSFKDPHSQTVAYEDYESLFYA